MNNMRNSVERSLAKCLYYPSSDQAQSNLRASCKNSMDFVQRLDLLQTLNIHNGCVNTVNWNASGTYMVSGSDDNHLVITETKSGLVALRSKTQHRRHIFSARFMPYTNDQAIISCSGEGIVVHTQFLTHYGAGKTTLAEAVVGVNDYNAGVFDCHKCGSTYDVLPLPDSPRSFLSCGEDGTVRCFDLRTSSNCSDRDCNKHIYIMAPCAVTAMDVSPMNHNHMAIGCADSIVRLYDRRMLSASTSTVPAKTAAVKVYPIPMKFAQHQYRPTCVKYSADERELLVSYSMDKIYIFDLQHDGYDDAKLLASGCYTHKLRRNDDPDAQMPRLRFRGDWSDTGPNSLSQREQTSNRLNVSQARPPLEPRVLNRLSDEILRMLTSQNRLARRERVLAPPGVLRSSRGWPDPEAIVLGAEQAATPATESVDSVRPDQEPEEQSEHQPEGQPDQEPPGSVNKFDYVKMTFGGHRNSRTMIKGACFWGDDYIMSGSDCGHIFVWQRQTGKVVKTLLADKNVVNRVQPHPTLPYLLSSGIDYNVKIWAPVAAKPNFDEANTKALMQNNAFMLNETRDIITVPAHIMIRILTTLHQYRREFNNIDETAAPAEAMDVVETVEEADAENRPEAAMDGTAANSDSNSNNNNA